MAEKMKRRNARPKYTPEIVRAVLYEAKFSTQTLTQIAEKYNISHASQISRWVRKYSSDFEEMSTIPPKLPEMTSTERQLQKSLEEAQMKIICLETLIDIAEKELNVPIRKKSGAKQ